MKAISTIWSAVGRIASAVVRIADHVERGVDCLDDMFDEDFRQPVKPPAAPPQPAAPPEWWRSLTGGKFYEGTGCYMLPNGAFIHRRREDGRFCATAPGGLVVGEYDAAEEAQKRLEINSAKSGGWWFNLGHGGVYISDQQRFLLSDGFYVKRNVNGMFGAYAPSNLFLQHFPTAAEAVEFLVAKLPPFPQKIAPPETFDWWVGLSGGEYIPADDSFRLLNGSFIKRTPNGSFAAYAQKGKFLQAFSNVFMAIDCLTERAKVTAPAPSAPSPARGPKKRTAKKKR